MKKGILSSVLTFLNLLLVMNIARICYKIHTSDFLSILELFLAGVILYFFYFVLIKRLTIRLVVMLISVSGIAIFSLLKQTYLLNIINEFSSKNSININELFNTPFIYYFREYKPAFIICGAILAAICIPVLTMVCIYLMDNGFVKVIIIMNIASLITFWYLGFEDIIKQYLLADGFICSISFAVMNYMCSIEKLKANKVKVYIRDYKSIFIIIIVYVVVCVTASLLPQKITGLSYTSLGDDFEAKYESGKSTLFSVKDSKSSSKLVFSAYTNKENKLGGPILMDGSLAFKVKSDTAYYLIGNVKDYYDGYKWTQSDSKQQKLSNRKVSLFLDTFSKSFMGKKKSIIIYPGKINTSTLFAPQYISNLDIKNTSVYWNSIPTFSAKTAVKNPYTISFYTCSSDALKSGSLGLKNGNIKYDDKMKKDLEVPKNISPRIYETVEAITKDCTSDIEKVNKISQYLKDNYTYSLSVSDVPSDHEFIDYFLFTEKKGYCTYFATATTILCRIAGIPARYVEGFHMTNIKDDNGLYMVKNSDAHAWTEVLLVDSSGKGLWVTVDSVPQNNASSSAAGNVDEYLDFDPYYIMVERYKNNATQTQMSENTDMNGESNGSAAGADKLAVHVMSRKTIIIIAISSVTFIIALLYIIAAILISIIKKNRLVKGNTVVPLYYYAASRLKCINIRKETSQSDIEFADSIKIEDLRKIMKEVVLLSYKEFYGNIIDHDFDKLEFYNAIEEYVKNRQNALVYYIEKYILHMRG